MANDTILQLMDLGLTITVTCKGYDASLDAKSSANKDGTPYGAPYINGIPSAVWHSQHDNNGDTHEHLLTSHCNPTKIVSVRYENQ